MYKSKTAAYFICLITAMLAMYVSPVDVHAQQASPAQQGALGIAAVVNDDVISALDLHTRTTMIIETSNMTDTPQTRARVSPQVLRGLIDEKLMLQEARRSGIKVVQEDIDDGVARIAQGNKMTVLQLSEQLKQIGVPLSSVSARIEAEIAWSIFAGRVLARKITISEEEITDEIKRIQASAGKPEYLLAEIFLPVDLPSQDNEVYQLALRLIEQMKSGAPFKAVASNMSRAPSAGVGGDMGWVQAAHLDTDIYNVVSKMNPGNVSMPIRTLGGYYIMLLREVRASPGLGGGEATLKLSQLHLAAEHPGATADLGPQLQNMSQGVTTCEQLDAIGAKDGSPMSGPLGEVPLSAMPQNMRALLQNLPAGQISPPIATGGGLAVMMVCARNDKGVDMEAVRADIAKRLKATRLDIAARRHLHDLRRDAFVDIRL